MDDFAALVGIDWSDSKHDIALRDTATGLKESSTIKHSAHSIDEWATSLREAALAGRRWPSAWSKAEGR